MIHSDTIKSLTEDEHLMLYSLCERIFNDMGLEMKYSWIKMMRVDVLIHFLNNIGNLRDEYVETRQGLINKLSQPGF